MVSLAAAALSAWLLEVVVLLPVAALAAWLLELWCVVGVFTSFFLGGKDSDKQSPETIHNFNHY